MKKIFAYLLVLSLASSAHAMSYEDLLRLWLEKKFIANCFGNNEDMFFRGVMPIRNQLDKIAKSPACETKATEDDCFQLLETNSQLSSDLTSRATKGGCEINPDYKAELARKAEERRVQPSLGCLQRDAKYRWDANDQVCKITVKCDFVQSPKKKYSKGEYTFHCVGLGNKTCPTGIGECRVVAIESPKTMGVFGGGVDHVDDQAK